MLDVKTAVILAGRHGVDGFNTGLGGGKEREEMLSFLSKNSENLASILFYCYKQNV